MNGIGTRKATPARPNGVPRISQELYLPKGEELAQTAPQYRVQTPAQGANGNVPLEGFKNNGDFEGGMSWSTQTNSRTQSSTLVEVNDPIQMHLLVETALSDSQEFEILSPEEVDNLKKQCRTLTTRIEQVRHNLAIQSKYRDAAISMSKLYSMSDRTKSPDGTEKKHRLSLLGSRSGSHSDHVREADIERLASERKCEELANELELLEKSLVDQRRKLLEHTAGILQVTHKGPVRVSKTEVGSVFQQGIPGSPESMYTYANGRRSLEQASEDIFDERSLYRMFDRIDNGGDKGESWDLGGESVSREIAAGQRQTISKTGQKLEDLNNRLRAIIFKTNPHRKTLLNNPPKPFTAEDSAADTLLDSHLDYLEQSISIMDEDQRRLVDDKRDSDVQVEEAINSINCKAQALLISNNPDIPPPPEVTGENIQDQLRYFENAFDYITSDMQQVASAKEKKVAEQQENIEKLETILRSIWDIIETGNPENDRPNDELLNSSSEAFFIQALPMKIQRLCTKASNLNDEKEVLQRQIKQQRELQGKKENTNDVRILQLEGELDQAQKDLQTVEGELDQAHKDLQTVESELCQTQNGLRTVEGELDQKRNDLQIVEGELDRVRNELRTVEGELDRTRNDLQTAGKETEDLKARLMVATTNLAESQRENTLYNVEKSRKEEAESTALKELNAKLQERSGQVVRLEEELQDLRDSHALGNVETRTQLAASASKVESLTSALAKAEEEVAKSRMQIDEKEAEMEHANMEIARLQTEVTIARAELDGAYGTRAQRAAEVASNPAIQKEIDDLNKRNMALQTEVDGLKASGGDEIIAKLKRELGETIEDFEEMTKASIVWEKEREVLEREIDKLQDEKEELEAKLGDEQVRWMGVKSPGSDSSPLGPGATTTMVLKSEFKKMMRDTRAENAKVLRAEQAERRRLEDELRLLKKMQGHGKSGLSHQIPSP